MASTASSYHVSRSRTYPAGVARSFDEILPVPLPDVLGHRVGPIPGVVEIRDQAGTWGEVGQTRTIVLADHGRLRETLTAVERPEHFDYRIEVVSGPMKPLVAHIDGRWAFDSAGTGVRVTWSWWIAPRSRLVAPLVPVVGRYWLRYADVALAKIERVLLPTD